MNLKQDSASQDIPTDNLVIAQQWHRKGFHDDAVFQSNCV